MPPLSDSRVPSHWIIAEYKDPGVPIFRGRPFIEALPPILDTAAAAGMFERFPSITEETLALPAYLRSYALEDLKQLYIPLGIHFEIERRISKMMRYRYVSHNPLDNAYWSIVKNQATSFRGLNIDNEPALALEGRSDSDYPVIGQMILGMPGIGKSSILSRILEHYRPILHTEYKGVPCNYLQIPLLYLEMNEDGSIKTFLQDFFKAVDRVTTVTNYYEKYARNDRRSAAAMMGDIPTIIALHGIGVIIIEELQALKTAKEGGDKRTLNFLVRLNNQLRVPIVSIGTFDTVTLLCGEFRQLRRAMGEGAIIWDRMTWDEDGMWDYFVETLWDYQYLRDPGPKTPQLSAILYDQTQGIPAFAKLVFAKAQSIALDNGSETITPEILTAAGEAQLGLTKAITYALRTGNRSAIGHMSDVFPIDVPAFLRDGGVYSTGGAPTGGIPEFPQPPRHLLLQEENTHSATVKSRANSRPQQKPVRVAEAREPADQSLQFPTPTGKSLLGIMKDAVDEKISHYEAAKRSGYIRDTSEYSIQ